MSATQPQKDRPPAGARRGYAPGERVTSMSTSRKVPATTFCELCAAGTVIGRCSRTTARTAGGGEAAGGGRGSVIAVSPKLFSRSKLGERDRPVRPAERLRDIRAHEASGRADIVQELATLFFDQQVDEERHRLRVSTLGYSCNFPCSRMAIGFESWWDRRLMNIPDLPRCRCVPREQIELI